MEKKTELVRKTQEVAIIGVETWWSYTSCRKTDILKRELLRTKYISK